jgi:hemolysin activation/secretion protein
MLLLQGSEPITNSLKIPVPTKLSQIPNSITPINPEQTTPTLPTPKTEPLQPPTTTPPTPSNTQTPPDASVRFLVKKFEFVGEHKAFTEKQLTKAVLPFTGKEITFAELLNAEKAILDLYIQGCKSDKSSKNKPCYINSDVFIPAGQNINEQNGAVKINIIEGSIEDIKVIGTHRLRPGYIRSRLALASRKPFDQKSLLAALQILEQDPLIEKISAAIVAGSRPGKSLLEVKVTEAKSFKAELFTDNGRASSVGDIRRGIRLNQSNLLGLGDNFGVSYTNTDGSNAFDANYTVPLNRHNGTLKIAGGFTNTDVVNPPFDRLDILGDSYYIDVSYRQPLLLTPTQEFALGLTVSREQSDTSLLGVNFPLSPGADNNGETRISALRFFQEWTTRSSKYVISLRSQFSFGLGLFDSTINEQAPDSRFVAWRGQCQYVYKLAPDTLLFLHSDLQVAGKSLVPLEQFSLGGLQSVRAYPQDVLLTDNGFLASAEVKLPIWRVKKVKGVLELVPFVDFGVGWNNYGSPEPNPNYSHNTLLGAGLGLEWQITNKVDARVDYGNSLMELSSNQIYFYFKYNPF